MALATMAATDSSEASATTTSTTTTAMLAMTAQCYFQYYIVFLETTPSSMAASWFKYNAYQLRLGEFSLAQRLWYWPFVWESVFWIMPGLFISAMHLFI